ncbi:MAG: peptidylprolyl isomerase [Gammaproteobacteria bacterium]|nr:peptidylprolyl isomerase [Gammaproteobacteria bacterium]
MNSFKMKHRTGALSTTAIVLAGMVLVSSLYAPSVSAQRQVLDKVVAIVDEGVVLQSELDARLEQVRSQVLATGQSMPPAAELRTQIIEMLVVENLQSQLAARMGIRYDDDTVNSVMQTLAEQNNLTFEDYIDALEAANQYIATREQIRKELSLRDLQRGMVNRRINITDQEIENFLNSEMGRVTMAPDYLVDQTLIPVGENDPADLIQAKQEFAQQMLDAIQSGTDFATARQIAQRGATATPPTAFPVTGGELGWRKAEALPTLFVDIVPTMRSGEVRGPVRSPSGFHLIKLSEIRGDINSLVNQTRARHILITPNEIRTEEQAKALIDNLHARIVNGESFADIARQNSDDSASVVAGGDMGWANEGGLPRDFETVIQSLDIGELSEPFRTSFGWHIAEVMERRERDMSREFSRQQAENTLRNRKFEVELQNWLIEIREQAYVKVIP